MNQPSSVREDPQSVPQVLTSDTAINVAGVYAVLLADIRHGTSNVTDFEHAARLTRLIEDALAAPQVEIRPEGDAWPIR